MLRLSLPALLALALALPAADKPPEGVLPTGADGKPLNLDFEAGDLRHWAAEGEAFQGQPVKGDKVHARRPDMHSGHAGAFWIGGYELKRDPPQGTLTSAPFAVTHRYAAFLVGGGPHESTRVELVRHDTGHAFFRASGQEREDMHREVVDLKDHLGKKVFIRLVDRQSGHWGHVNFDDFKLYKDRPNFPDADRPRRPADLIAHAGLSPDEAAKAMQLPEGFKAIAFAGEPDVRQPIAMTLDDRGRLWVAEAYGYPHKQPRGKGRDRILIFEDADGDGKFDRRTVFTEGLNLVSGLEVGFGGVWVGQAPELLFIPDKNGDDKPDGPPEVVLDGWGLEDTHETLNSFIWGPDGWLYGCHGVFTHSRVGKPGTPPDKRVPINAGIWRYHPTREKFEVFAWGTSNPWGVDFDDKGQAILTCCVIPHLFHVIQGARYHRQAGTHFQEHTYADIPTIARHRHWVGNQWNEADRARSDASGGGHAHAGAMIYLGGAWPAEYRGKLLMNNIHGARINMDRLAPKGSGLVGDGDPDFCKTNDLFSQILYLRYGPDGQVYLIDWYDRQQCHRVEAEVHDRSNGRIFKIVHGDGKGVQVNLAKKTDAELVDLQLHKNDWYVRHARRLLQERAAAGKLSPDTHAKLEELAFTHADGTRRLRGLWALHVTGGLNGERVARGLAHDDPFVRAWTIQLALEDEKPSEKTLKTLAGLAKSDPSQVVRLYVASAGLRLPLAQRWDLMEGLLSHAEDKDDHNLPLMYWYAAEPLAGEDQARALQLASAGKVPLVLEFMIRRVATEGSPQALDLLVKGLSEAKGEGQLLFLRGIQSALVGRRSVPMPKSWAGVYTRLSASPDDEVRTRARSLAVTFGDAEALAQMRRLLTSAKAPIEERRQCLETLLGVADKELPGVLHELVKGTDLRREALRGLAAYEDPKTPKVLLSTYDKFDREEKRDALMTLCARPAYARDLLAALEAKKVPANDLTADLVRQLRNLKDDEVTRRLEKVWVVRETDADKAKLITQYKKLLAEPAPARVLPHGRAVFAKTCQQCHKLFGTGGDVGPELTGANRSDLDYLLSNILDPSAVMGKDYIASIIETTRGRVLTGLIKAEDKNALTVVTANETVVLPRKEVDTIMPSDRSMMPDDLLQPLAEDEVRALVAYLQSGAQVPLPLTADNAKDFFDGKALAGWSGNPEVWKVEDGQVAARTDGSAREHVVVNELLAGDFRLTLEVQPAGPFAIGFRGERTAGGFKGYRLESSGELHEADGRGLLARASSAELFRPGEWNRVEVTAQGDRIRVAVNGKVVHDISDPPGARRGVTALIAGDAKGDPTRFKDLRLEVLK